MCAHNIWSPYTGIHNVHAAAMSDYTGMRVHIYFSIETCCSIPTYTYIYMITYNRTVMTIIARAWLYRGVRLRAMMQSGWERTNREVTMPGPRAGRDRSAAAEVNPRERAVNGPARVLGNVPWTVQPSTAPPRWRCIQYILSTQSKVYAHHVAVNIASPPSHAVCRFRGLGQFV